MTFSFYQDKMVKPWSLAQIIICGTGNPVPEHTPNDLIPLDETRLALEEFQAVLERLRQGA